MKTPKAPDPVATAQAQSGMNTDTALTQQLVNHTNQVGPWGSTTYSQNGTSSFTDSSGRTISIPQFTQTTEYSPGQQAIFDKTQTAQTNLADLSAEQSGKMRDYLAKPFEFNNHDAENWATDLASRRILPQQQRDRTDLQAQLVNSGIRPGTEAYDREMSRLDRSNNDQMNQLALTGRSQAYGEALETRSQPINELSAFMSGSQIQAPNAGFSPTPQATVGGVDYTGLVNQQYQGQMQSHNAMLGGLFGLAGAGLSAAFPAGKLAKASDRRVKTDIKRVGALDNGLPVYSYRYRWGGPVEIGVMAQDVERVRPHAVVEIGGIKAVDYQEAVA